MLWKRGCGLGLQVYGLGLGLEGCGLGLGSCGLVNIAGFNAIKLDKLNNLYSQLKYKCIS